MKNSLHLLLFLTSFLLINCGYSQVNYSTDFENAADRTLWSFNSSTTRACSGNSEYENCYSSNTTVSEINSTSLGTSNGCVATVQFDYKILEYNSSTAAASSDLNDLIVYSGATATGPWTARYTLPSHTSSTSCVTRSFTYTHPAGATFLKFEATWAAGDWDIYFDNISIIEDSPLATITKTCASDLLSYSLNVQVTNLGGATGVDINDGTTTYETNVGLGTYIISGLTSAATINVKDNAGTCQYSEAITMCVICESSSLPTDECVNAPLIDLSQSFYGSTSCSYTAGADPDGSSSCGNIDNDSWISFIAGSTDVEIEYDVGTCSGSNTGIQLTVFSGSCGSMSDIPGSCLNQAPSESVGSWTFSGLTIGDTYHIWIDGYAGQLCDYSFTPISGVVITPENDSCFTAITLACGGSDTASNILATDGDAPTACTGGGTTSKGNWYTFTGTGQAVTISTDGTATNFDTEINIYSGACNALVCVGGDDDSGTGTTSEYTFTATNATVYSIYVDGKGAAQGQYEISLTCSACAANAGTWN